MTEEMDEFKARKTALKRLKRLANQQASIRSFYHTRLRAITRAIDILVLLVGLGLAVLAFACTDYWPGESKAQVSLVAWVSLLNFAASILVLYFRPADAAQAQRDARRHYTATRLQASELAKRDDVTKEEFDAFKVQYLDDVNFPDVPDALFTRYKAKHLLKVAISAELDDRPGLTMRSAKKAVKARLTAKGDESP